MEGRTQQPLFPLKSISFSSASTREDKKLRDSDRNLSLDSTKFNERYGKHGPGDKPASIDEGKEEEDDIDEADLVTISEDVESFITSFRDTGTTDIPDTVGKFIDLVEQEVSKYDTGEQKWSSEIEHGDCPLLPAVDRLANLASLLEQSSEGKYSDSASRAAGTIHHAMCFLEDEFYTILDEPRTRHLQQDQHCTITLPSSKAKRGTSFGRNTEQPDHCLVPQLQPIPESAPPSPFPVYTPEAVAQLSTIANAMLSAGYDTECCQLFTIARRNATAACITENGFEKASIDEVQRMAWDSLEAEIAKWIQTFRFTITEAFPHERDLCNEVFSDHKPIVIAIFRNIVRNAIIHLLTFAEAVAITKRSAEKLFKILDMYEAIRDLTPQIEQLLCIKDEGQGPVEQNTEHSPCIKNEGQGPVEQTTEHSPCIKNEGQDLISEISSAKLRLGEAAVSIFCDLETSIKSDTGKTPVPSGAVHPLTRYTLNYLKYACEYKTPLEQCFNDHQNLQHPPSPTTHRTPFASQLLVIMELLHSNITSKSKLYRDLALSNIFMMNNIRYIAQKIKTSSDMNQLLGETWCRKKSSEVRQYHKNYQRETWARVLACFKDEGLTVKGTVQKPVLKERLKTFNAMFEEIHKMQSSWVVSDEQMQSELRVSVSAVVVPAYRSFLGRFGGCLDPGRQTEKYVKFGVEDLENYIDELFDGNQNSMGKKRT